MACKPARERQLRMFKSRVPREIFGPKAEVTCSRVKPCNEELYVLYSLPNIAKTVK